MSLSNALSMGFFQAVQPIILDCWYPVFDSAEQNQKTARSLAGNIINSPEHDNGEPVVITDVVSVFTNEDGDRYFRTEDGEIYQFGEIDNEYEAEHPDAMDLIFGNYGTIRRLN